MSFDHDLHLILWFIDRFLSLFSAIRTLFYLFKFFKKIFNLQIFFFKIQTFCAFYWTISLHQQTVKFKIFSFFNYIYLYLSRSHLLVSANFDKIKFFFFSRCIYLYLFRLHLFVSANSFFLIQITFTYISYQNTFICIKNSANLN